MHTKGMTTTEVKKFNKSKVYELIYKSKNISKQGLSQTLHMGMNTVTQSLKQLEEEGLIERSGYFSSTGGRKALDIHILPAAAIAAGIEILKDMVHFVLVDLYGTVIEHMSHSFPFSPTESYCRKLGQHFLEFVSRTPEYSPKILGVSIAIQGLISVDGKSVQYGEILHHTGMKLDDFSSYIPYPCSLIHDSKAAAYREAWHQEERKDAVVLLLNENLGGGVILNGQVHQGLHMHSGTIEHICINPQGPLCYCGQKGCLETYCSAGSLIRQSGTTLSEFFGQLKEKTAFQNIWEAYLCHLAFAIRNLNMLLDCSVIISGMAAPYFTDEDMVKLKKEVNRLTPFPLEKDFIYLSSHGVLAPPAGAALSYIDRFLESV